MLTRLLVAAYFIETGLILVVGPWTALWRRNFFAEVLPWLPALMASPIVQVGVALTGIMTMLTGLSDAWRVLFGDSSAGGPARDTHSSP